MMRGRSVITLYGCDKSHTPTAKAHAPRLHPDAALAALGMERWPCEVYTSWTRLK